PRTPASGQRGTEPPGQAPEADADCHRCRSTRPDRLGPPSVIAGCDRTEGGHRLDTTDSLANNRLACARHTPACARHQHRPLRSGCHEKKGHHAHRTREMVRCRQGLRLRHRRGRLPGLPPFLRAARGTRGHEGHPTRIRCRRIPPWSTGAQGPPIEYPRQGGEGAPSPPRGDGSYGYGCHQSTGCPQQRTAARPLPGPDAREQGGQPAAGDRRRFGVLMSSLFSDWLARQSAAPEAHAPAPEAQADVAAEAPAPDARPAEAEAAPVGADASGAVTAEPVAESGAGTAGAASTAGAAKTARSGRAKPEKIVLDTQLAAAIDIARSAIAEV